MASTDNARLALLRLRRAARKDIKRMSPEDASDWVDVISAEVGGKVQSAIQSWKYAIDDARQDIDAAEKSWGKWDWRVLHDMGFLDRENYKFVQDFLGTYSR